ncbi:MAG: peroxiredoxin [Bdellovibrionota bacterium]
MAVQGIAIGTQVPEFSLKDQNGQQVQLADILRGGPALLVFYPGDFTMVCTKQLCNYRDNLEAFNQFGIQIVGISGNPSESHAEFAKEYDFSFRLLSDPKKEVAKAYGCNSLLMLGGVSRAVFIVGKNGRLLYRYVEPTALTRRKADELIEVLKDLRAKHML